MKPFEIDVSYIRAKDVKRPLVETYTAPVAVCHAMDVREYEMREFDFIKGKKVLIAKQRGRIHALGSLCPHANAPLVKGVLGEGRIRCPWHGSCFNLETGDIEDYPGVNSLPRYKVDVERGGLVMVRARVQDVPSSGRMQKMVKRDLENPLVYLIIGGGIAAQMCAATLRKEGFTGRILMICKEPHLPYNRTNLTKYPNAKMKQMQFRPKEFYDEYNIEMLLDTEAVKANMEEKTITTSDDVRFFYNKMLIATGSSARKPSIKGIDLKNVFTLRDYEDWEHIREASKAKNVVCIGSSYIVLEVAQNIISYAHTKTTVTEVEGDADGNVIQLTLSDGQQLPCQCLIIGAGVRCNTDFLVGSGLPINANGSIEADMYLKTLFDDVYVGGDLAHAPVHSDNNRCSAIGHEQIAQYHGRVAAINMAGSRLVDLRTVPFYTTSLFKIDFRCAGIGRYSDIVFEGDVGTFNFVAYYLDNLDKVISIVACNRDPIVSQFAELRSQGRILRRHDLLDVKKPWTARLKGPIKCY
ncbi:hypothetical protein GQX74_010561 [Glossina fuscipes]|nr:hypothetical protein GQX74_010561 [Glossina fuscipes]